MLHAVRVHARQGEGRPGGGRALRAHTATPPCKAQSLPLQVEHRQLKAGGT